MKNLRKQLTMLIGGVFLGSLLFASISSATPLAPPPPEPTQCADCQDIQGQIDTAYADLGAAVDATSMQAGQLETLLDEIVMGVYEGDPGQMVDQLTAQVETQMLLTGASCDNPANTVAYYSSFNYDGASYCFADSAMYFDPAGFFEAMIVLASEYQENPDLPGQIADVQMNWIESITDYNQDETANIEDILAEIEELMTQLEDCELEWCPILEGPPECPDCEKLADALKDAISNHGELVKKADALFKEMREIEAEIEKIQEQMGELSELQDELRKMVKDAGGMTDADCDGFKPESGQAWGVAHNFGDVQWCFTSEGQIEKMIENLDEYWKTNKSKHLPSSEELKASMDKTVTDYNAKSTEYGEALNAVEESFDKIKKDKEALEECLENLKSLQEFGECEDQDAASIQKAIDEAAEAVKEPYNPEPTPEIIIEEEKPAEEDKDEEEKKPADKPDDAKGHWAEDFITDLFTAGVVSGDAETGDFRPNDLLNRAEATKIVSLAKGDDTETCDSDLFPDVASDSWFCSFVTNAKTKGYFGGYDDGSFGPGNPILRAEAAAVVLRALDVNVPEYATYTFPDITGEEWYADYAQKAYECEIFEGREMNGQKIFAGGAEITRAEFAKVVDLTLMVNHDVCPAQM